MYKNKYIHYTHWYLYHHQQQHISWKTSTAEHRHPLKISIDTYLSNYVLVYFFVFFYYIYAYALYYIMPSKFLRYILNYNYLQIDHKL